MHSSRLTIVQLERRAGLFREHAARTDDEDMIRRKRDASLEPHRRERILYERARPRAQDRRLILTATEGADPTIARQRTEWRSALDRAEVAGQIVGTRDGLTILVVSA